jgi:adenosine deaminase
MIEIHEYDPSWPARFEALAARARAALGALAVTVEHIGSTAVPGLAAKPIIDLNVVIHRGRMAEAISRLEKIGYVHEGDLGVAGRQAFREPSKEARHHLYMLEQGAQELSRNIAFRDALRADSSLRARYAALKRWLAAKHGSDRESYSHDKAAFVASAICNRPAATDEFCRAISNGDLQAVRACPKADLHTHNFAKADRDYIREKTGRDIEPVTTPLASMAEMHAWAKANLADLFDGQRGRTLAIEANFVGTLKDGVTRIEFGDDVWMITQGLGSPRELVDSISRIHRRMAPNVEWIPQLGLSRHCSVPDLQEWMAPWLDLGFHTVLDLSGDELVQPIEMFKPLYRAAKNQGMRLKAHIGEWGTADDVQHAVEVLELDEVQHGISAAQSPTVMRFLADRQIRLNMCPTSNILLGRVARLQDHPIRRLFDAGVKVTVNSDDAIVFGVGVSEEFLRLYQAGVFTAKELDQIRRWGLD